MTWHYSQSTGQLTHDGRNVGRPGYSGAPAGINNPDMQQIVDVGPIPRGQYRIGRPRDTETHGPHVMDLTPVGHTALGRSQFLIHGDRVAGPPRSASQGCIILPPDVRDRISGSGDNSLVVDR